MQHVKTAHDRSKHTSHYKHRWMMPHTLSTEGRHETSRCCHGLPLANFVNFVFERQLSKKNMQITPPHPHRAITTTVQQ